MKIGKIRRALGLVSLVLPISWTPGSVESQAQAAASAESFGVAVSTSTINQKSPYAVLPDGGAMAEDQAESFTVADMVTADNLFAIATGAADATYGTSAESNATLGNVSILNGLITADGVVAMASSAKDAGVVGSNTGGSSLANLVVNGVGVSDPAPNTRIDLPGVGYVVLNEVSQSGDGVSSSGVTVNMIHVVLQSVTGGECTPLGCTPEVVTTIGDIIVGSASSAVQ